MNKSHKIINKSKKNKTRKNLKEKSSFLSLCFQYYQENILKNNRKKIILNKMIESGPIFIIDYPNIIHILHEKYKNKNKVIFHFYSFVYHQLYKKNAKIIIISKLVHIDNIEYLIDDIFIKGYELTHKKIDSFYFTNESIIIYHLNYKYKVSSSYDDLIGYFICLVLFVYLQRSNINPLKKYTKYIQKLNMITNDTQNFNKNLFGLTLEEQKYFSIKGNEFTINTLNSNYEMIYGKIDQKLLYHFFHHYVIKKVDDIYHLECYILGIINKLKTQDSPFVTYYKFKQLYEKNKHSLCKKERINQYIYLYSFIKLVQMHIFQGNVYGSIDKNSILKIIG